MNNYNFLQTTTIFLVLILLDSFRHGLAAPRRNVASAESENGNQGETNPASIMEPFFQPSGLIGGAFSDPSVQSSAQSNAAGGGGFDLGKIISSFSNPGALGGGAAGAAGGSPLAALPNVMKSINLPGMTPDQKSAMSDQMADMATSGQFMMEVLQEPGGVQQFMNLLNDKEVMKDLLGGMGGGGGSKSGGGGSNGGHGDDDGEETINWGKKRPTNGNNDGGQNNRQNSGNDGSDGEETINWGKRPANNNGNNNNNNNNNRNNNNNNNNEDGEEERINWGKRPNNVSSSQRNGSENNNNNSGSSEDRGAEESSRQHDDDAQIGAETEASDQ